MNFVKIKKISLLYNTYAYIDSKDYTIDKILTLDPICIYFDESEYRHPSFPNLCICICKVLKGKNDKKLTEKIFPYLDKNLTIKYGQEYTNCIETIQFFLEHADEIQSGELVISSEIE